MKESAKLYVRECNRMPHKCVCVPRFVIAAIRRTFYVVSTPLHCVARQATQDKLRQGLEGL